MKFDLQYLVYIFNFLYTDRILNEIDTAKYLLFYKEGVLERIKSFDFGADKTKKTLVDIGIPSSDVKTVDGIIKKSLTNKPISYSTVLDALKNSFEKIAKKESIQDITKELISALIE